MDRPGEASISEEGTVPQGNDDEHLVNRAAEPHAKRQQVVPKKNLEDHALRWTAISSLSLRQRTAGMAFACLWLTEKYKAEQPINRPGERLDSDWLFRPDSAVVAHQRGDLGG